MTYNINSKNNVNVLTLEGNLISEYDNKDLLDEVTSNIELNGSKFVIDLSNLETLNSSGLGVLITILTKTRKAGGDAIITNISENIEKLLIITKLNTVFNFAEDLETAIKQLEN